MLTLMAVVLLAGSLVVAAGFDLWRFEIPDTLSILVLISSALYILATPGLDWPSHLAAGGVVFAVGLFVFSRGWLGGGDVKLLAAAACWADLTTLLSLLADIAVAGGVLALALIVVRRLARAAYAADMRLPRLAQMDAPVPYAVAIAAGIFIWSTQHLAPLVGDALSLQ